ncbi:MAG TPA: lysine 2,3-aminomutase [Anaerolineae bacterium]|nr:lysine 2,3-aminomutase [Anaerolineae bacterium]
MDTEKEAQELEEPPGCSPLQPPHPWEAVPLASWRDWRWQLAHRLNSVEDLGNVIHLTKEEIEGLSARGRFRVDVTPYFASLMDPDDAACPIRRQVIPTSQELVPYRYEMADSLAEDRHSPVPGLVHRYPDRVLMLVTTQCASYCRYCTRSRLVGDPAAQLGRKAYDAQIEYISRTPMIRDVLLSGGDPLTLPQNVLEDLLRRLRSIEHVEVVRIGSRVPIFLPMRITPDLTSILRKYHPLWMNVHVNHPREITPDVRQALARLADAGIPLGNQSVLLAGINDCPNVMRDLVHALVKSRVRPYYIYQCDMVHGAGHFRTPVSVGVDIVESLRGHTSGFAVPTYVIDAPHGGGKIPVMPNYVLSQSPDRVVVRNYLGFITAYTQPDAYLRHDSSNCTSCQSHILADPQESESVAALLSGRRSTIEPLEVVDAPLRPHSASPEIGALAPAGANGHLR